MQFHSYERHPKGFSSFVHVPDAPKAEQWEQRLSGMNGPCSASLIHWGCPCRTPDLLLEHRAALVILKERETAPPKAFLLHTKSFCKRTKGSRAPILHCFRPSVTLQKLLAWGSLKEPRLNPKGFSSLFHEWSCTCACTCAHTSPSLVGPGPPLLPQMGHQATNVGDGCPNRC